VDQSERPYEFDVALSFAGEDRLYVHEVARHLRANDIRVFYDDFFTTELWGQDLYSYLDTVYRERSRFTVVFISQSYVAKPWPSHERQSAQARALNDLGPYLLPVRFDDSVLPGLRPTVSYIEASRVTPEQLAALIINKLKDATGIVPPAPSVIGVPRTVEEQRQLLSQRPRSWEYLFYASVLLMRRADIEEKWRDYEMRYARRTGKYLDDRAAWEYTKSARGILSGILGEFDCVLTLDAQRAAFGTRYESGSPEKIEHLATRFIDVYQELLDWAQDLRGTSVSSRLIDTLELTARLADGPIRQMREFVDTLVAQAEKLPELEDRGEPVTITMTLKLHIDDEVRTALKRDIERIGKLFRAGNIR
jgi:hypothetical protein